MQKSSCFLVNLQIFKNITVWLTGLLQLMDEEQSEAGIYLGYKHDK